MELKQADHKIKIIITAYAYAKICSLIIMSPVEIGWNCLIRQTDETSYEIYDVIMYPQTVSPARTTDVTKDNRWLEELTDDQINNMRCWSHSHVKMSTCPSSIDVDNWRSKLNNMKSTPFYLFQIWNKLGEINSFMFDLKNEVLYTGENVEIEISTGITLGELNEFVEQANRLLTIEGYEKGEEDGSVEVD